ncbi:uncharacterized protein LOC102721222 [Oryza brachyantha]|uniref:uncharacterized protein LOC102721222 n=1 Tax=Oryza brachyantha TaxID=4533 RepID=UPI001ADD5131|nr:uncharacterized protein LOC102721222 [Oryza brachyantha]
MDHRRGGGRSSSRLRDRLARMFRPGSLLRSTCNNAAASTSSSSASGGAAAAAAGAKKTTTTAGGSAATACSSSRALLAADAAAVDRESFLGSSSRRDYAALVGRTESFSTALDRLHRRGAPLPTSRFSVDASPPLVAGRKEKEEAAAAAAKEKETSAARDVQSFHYHHRRHGSLGGGAKSDKTRRLLSNPYGFSTSDDADTDGDDVFSSDADDRVPGAGGGKKGEAEAFFSSSRSFSSDSSEFYTKKKTKPKKKSPSSIHSAKPPPPPPPPPRTTRQRRKRRAASSCDTCGVRDGFRPVVSAAEEQVRRGFAVVKRSRDPYADFRSSMVEMVFGRQLFGAAELERLLRSYLSLNAPRHHPVILQAFSDIWVVLHGG